MSMSGHVNSLCSSLTYQLRNISRICRFLDYDTCHLVTCALVLSRIDYGNGLLLGANKSDIQRLQRIQNWAAKLVCKSHRWDHATPCLRELYWLTVDKRITFKVLKCLNMISPCYPSTSVSPYRHAIQILHTKNIKIIKIQINKIHKKVLKTPSNCTSQI